MLTADVRVVAAARCAVPASPAGRTLGQAFPRLRRRAAGSAPGVFIGDPA